ncbi:MAG: NAD(P)-dependent alcohol dehydrogenase [Chloroflexi bacterium]|nr:NAD(P)-dependent alcohol dehydrogenase [Chloroflexota bacterium]MCH9038280.1 NAD(P)-dependent alcohol dehydrogenase [Chloroflexota bacterium]MCI0795884.1 NAD(P)-dependent alcohol dehydrogenase [Chloroflexota bacterium]MCI0812909.1 NAD(P)-dependent alcohol dehydrogenase [Chloroflexota bacterium]MCI0840776.1 NAD(P)-dependent alcohol dehydrogenase [Chloroflexota bacterium]
MKAVVYTEYGSPDVLQLKEVEKPTPEDNGVLIKIHATTVNRTDCGFLRAKPFIVRFFSGLAKPRNTILGNEFAGQIEAIGKDVTSFAVGDNVFGFDGDTFGAHAEYMAMPEDGVLATMPAGMSYVEAAPSNEGAHYALNYIKKADIQQGKNVLINGATGAIGSAAVQLMKYFGAEVTAVSDTARLELVKSLGATRVIDYEKEDFTQLDEAFDVVFDAVGKSTFFKCKPLLKPDGIYFSTEPGPYWQNPLLALWTPFFSRKKLKFPIPKHTKGDIEFFKELIEAGEYKPVIDRTYPMEQIIEAYKYVEQGQKTGNVVITVDHNN